MAAFIEWYASREIEVGKNPSATMLYRLWGTEDEFEILDTLLLNSYAWYGFSDNPRYDLSRHSAKVTPMGNGFWQGEVKYGPHNISEHDPNKPNSGENPGGGDPLTPDVKINVTGQNQHITQSLYTVSKTPAAGQTAMDYKGAIGVSMSDGKTASVAGCDIPVPLVEWTETWTFLAAFITWGYVKNCRNMYGRANQNPFRSFLSGEVMFMGFTSENAGVQSKIALRKNTYSFKSQPSATFTLTPDFSPVTKGGWEYVWVDYIQDKDASGKGLITKPRAVYVERVGRPGIVDAGGNQTNLFDFSDPTAGLGIGS
jgi:hypothetical protein